MNPKNAKRSLQNQQTQQNNQIDSLHTLRIKEPETRKVSGFSNFAERRVLTTSDDFTAEPTWKQQKLDSFRYIPFLSYDNYLLNELQEIAIHSPTNAAILRQKQRFVNGNGLNLVRRKAILGTSSDEEIAEATALQIEEYLQVVNPEGETFEEVKKKVTADLIQYGNAFVHLVKGEKVGAFYQYHIPVKDVRIVKMKSNERMPSKVGISRYFESDDSITVPEYVEEYPIYPKFGTPTGYNGQKLSTDVEGEHSIIHIKEDHADFVYWGVPSYLAAKLAAQAEYKINKFNNSQLDNGFMPSGIMQFFGNAPADIAKKVVENFKNEYTGTGNNSRLVAQFIANPEYAAKFIQLSEKYEGQFLEMFDLSQRQIIIAHGWTPALAGIAIAGQLGNVQQLKTEFEVIKNTTVKSYQNILRTQYYSPIIKEAAEVKKVDWKGLTLENIGFNLVGVIGELAAAEVMTEQEKRLELGLSNE